MKKIQIKNLKWFSVILLVLFGLSNRLPAQEVETDLAEEPCTDKIIDVAYGKQTQKSIASSISTIYAEDIQKNLVDNVGESLFGRLPGLTVQKGTGEPGSLPSLTIRGYNTYGNNNPLILVDGFRTNYGELSVYEIESISVLKDAAALALYGQEAANGAILITTNRGVVGETQIDISFNTGWQSPTQIPNLLNAAEYATLYNEALVNDGLEPRYSQADIAKYGTGGLADYTHPDNRFYETLLKPSAPIMQGGINISGGSDKVRYRMIFGFLNNGGIYNYTDLAESYSTQADMQRYNLRSNLDISITDHLSARIDVGGSLLQRNFPGVTNTEVFNAMMNTPPQEYAMINPDGTPGGSAQFTDNPYGLIALRGYKSYTDRSLNTTLFLTYDFDEELDGLKLSAGGSVSNWMRAWDNKEKSQFAVYAIDELINDSTATYTKYNDDQDLTWVTNAISNQRMNFEVNATYDKEFGESKLSTMLMFHLDQYTQSTNHYKFRNAGLGLRVHYGLKDKYFAELTSGYYGQEQYASGKRYGLFPAGALAWIASEEDFLKDVDAVDFLKLRASYGMVGGGMAFTGDNLTNRIYFNQYYSGAAASKFGDNSQTNYAGRQEGRLANPNITWDKSYKTDLAVEAILFGHVKGMFNYYHDRRTDILTIDNQIPATFGMNNGREAFLNNGEVVNKGYEATLEYFGNSGDFEYSIQGGIWHNKSEIISKPDATIYEYDHRSVIGKPVGQIFGYETAGFFDSDAAAASSAYTQSFGDVGAGDVIYVNQTGEDMLIDNNDKIAMGYTGMPEYTYSVGIELKYKGLSLSAFGQGTMNGSAMMGGFYIPFNTQGNALSYAHQRWSETTKATAKYPRLSTVSNSNNTQASDIWLVSTDYFKLRNVEVGYDLAEIISDGMFKNARIYVRGMNLLTISKEIDFVDVESQLSYPSMKSVSLGISVLF